MRRVNEDSVTNTAISTTSARRASRSKRSRASDFTPEAVAATAKAMSVGRQVIVQGAFLADNWPGRPDVLLRVDIPSSLGDWSYEVVDTKLSRDTKGGTVLQLCLYSPDLLVKAQGLTPRWFHVIGPWSEYNPKPLGRMISPHTIDASERASNRRSSWTKPSRSTRIQNPFVMCAVGRTVATPPRR